MDHNYTYYSDLKQNDVVVILGATHGDFIRERKNEILQKNVFVINVEPTFEGCTSLASFIKSNMPMNACIVSCAVSDFNGFLELDIRDNLITSTFTIRPETNQRWPMNLLYRTTVPVFTLDTVLQGAFHTFGRVDKIFCDIEGSELEAFGPSKLKNDVPYIAIAAYHMRGTQQTHEIMSKWDWDGKRAIIDGEPSQHKHELMFFAIKE